MRLAGPVLCLAMLAGLAVYAMPALAFKDINASSKYYNAASRLNELNIISGDPDGMFNPNNNVTRAEMAKIICLADGLSPAKTSQTNTTFADVPQSYWAAGYIAAANNLGFINGNSDGTFLPANNVTYEQALKMIMSLLGYAPVAEELGGYPPGYLKLANDLKITNEVSGDLEQPMTRGEIALLINNALDTPLMLRTSPDSASSSDQIQNGSSGTSLRTLITEKLAKDIYQDIGGNVMSVSFKVLNQLRQSRDLQDKNIMFSPFSLQMAFIMLANGAEGNTRQEILQTFGVNDLQRYNNAAKAAIQALNANQDITFNISNSVWLNKDYYPGLNVAFTTPFKNDMQNYFSADAREINNANGAKTINNWISGKTNNKINDVLTDQEIESLLLCLVNTIYFKADWQASFTKEATAKAAFTDQKGKTSQVDFMHQVGYFNYYEDSSMQMLEMCYKGANVSMYVILPTENNAGLAGIDQKAVENALANKSRQYVHISMPKFKTETTMDLINPMKALGITTAFEPNCHDLTDKLITGMTNGDNVYVQLVRQKSFIQVDEKGTEAAATTVTGGMTTTSIPPQPKVFNANRPFMYLIRDNISGDIYFMGQYSFTQ